MRTHLKYCCTIIAFKGTALMTLIQNPRYLHYYPSFPPPTLIHSSSNQLVDNQSFLPTVNKKWNCNFYGLLSARLIPFEVCSVHHFSVLDFVNALELVVAPPLLLPLNLSNELQVFSWTKSLRGSRRLLLVAGHFILKPSLTTKLATCLCYIVCKMLKYSQKRFV